MLDTKIIENLRTLEYDFVVSESGGQPAEVPEKAGFSPHGLAKKTIGKALRKVSKWPAGKNEGLSIPELHQIRIDCKRLRYTCEFFDDILGQEMERMVRSFVRVQDCLGDFNDAHAAAEKLRNLADSYPNRMSKEVLLVLGALVQIQRDCAENYRIDFLKLWDKLPKQTVRLQKGQVKIPLVPL